MDLQTTALLTELSKHLSLVNRFRRVYDSPLKSAQGNIWYCPKESNFVYCFIRTALNTVEDRQHKKHWAHIGLPVHQGLLLPRSVLMSGTYFPQRSTTSARRVLTLEFLGFIKSTITTFSTEWWNNGIGYSSRCND